MAARVIGARVLGRGASAGPAWEVLDQGRKTLDMLLARWRLPPRGEAKLIEVLCSEPVSAPRSTRHSVAAAIPSQKMRRLIRTASRTVEAAFYWYCEYDDGVLIYLEQPLTVKILIVNRRGQRRQVPYTCDFLVVRADGVYVYECKALDWLREQTQHPHPRYVCDESGREWRHPAAQEAFDEYGFKHTVFHSGDINLVWLRNVRFLADFGGGEAPEGVRAMLEEVVRCASVRGRDLLRVSGATREALFWLIANVEVAVDLERERLFVPEGLDACWVHVSQDVALCQRQALEAAGDVDDTGWVARVARRSVKLEPGERVVFRDEPYEVVSSSDEEVVLGPTQRDGGEEGSLVVLGSETVDATLREEILCAHAPSREDAVSVAASRVLSETTEYERVEALKRWKVVCEYRRLGNRVPEGVARSSCFRFLEWVREGKERFGNEFLGLFRPRGTRRRGCTLSEEARKVLDRAVLRYHGVSDGEDEVALPKGNVAGAYSEYVADPLERSVKRVSPSKFRREVKRYSRELSERARRGRRASERFAPPSPVVRYAVPVGGDRPFEAGKLDHQLLNVLCVSGRTGAVLGRPWWSPVFDGYSKVVLGFALRFDAPSAYTVLCAIGDVVRRHERFVDTLTVDGASEFEALDVEAACAYLWCGLQWRAGGRPRWGAEIERNFGSVQTRLVDHLRGRVDTIARTRELSPEHAPEGLAVWTLPSLARALAEYCFQVYPNLIHKGLKGKPGKVFDAGMRASGHRKRRFVRWDDSLGLALSQSVKGANGTRTVSSGTVLVSSRYYRVPVVDRNELNGRSLSVRHCAMDASFVYVRVPELGGWVRSEVVSDGAELANCSWREAQALMEVRRRAQMMAGSREALEHNARELGEFYAKLSEQECVAFERRLLIEEEQRIASEESEGAGSAVPFADPRQFVWERARDEGEGLEDAPTSARDELKLDLSLLRSYDDEYETESD